jgi:NAD-specific glutamate dehydrogenase
MNMSATEQDILQTLIELENAVKAMAGTHPKLNLSPLFMRIDALTDQLPKNTDATLLHYLHRKSYETARLWLEGRESENQAGSCRQP